MAALNLPPYLYANIKFYVKYKNKFFYLKNLRSLAEVRILLLLAIGPCHPSSVNNLKLMSLI